MFRGFGVMDACTVAVLGIVIASAAANGQPRKPPARIPLPSLETVVDHYDSDLKLHLTAEQKQQLVQYLKSL